MGNLVEPVSDRRWDRQEMTHQIAARVRRYRSERITPGDRIFVHFGNRLEFFADLLALWRLGACVIPLDGRLTEFEIKNLARVAAPRCSVVDDRSAPTIVASLSSANVKVINTLEIESLAVGADDALSDDFPRLDDDALILFTSGSTASPKGVLHTHRSLQARWTALQQKLGLEAYRRTLCLLPTHFGHGLICNCLFPWLSGQDLFIMPPFNPELIMRLGPLIDHHKITFLSSVPAVWKLALKISRPPGQGTLQRIHCGSAPLSAYLWKEIQVWASTKEVFNAYGITETGSWVAGTTVGDFIPEDGLIGEPWGAVIKTMRTGETRTPPNQELECKPNEPGYIWLRTPALMKGYFKREDLTDEAVCQGWFLTGDIGTFDERGRLYLKGREREEINKGGIKIYPADIDAVVERFDRTKDVAAFGFDDPLYGQEVGMAVALKNQDTATIRDLYRWMRLHLPEHKMPMRWYLVDSIPRTSRGKINRSAIMERCTKLRPLDLREILQASEEG